MIGLNNQPHTYEPDPDKGTSEGCSDWSFPTRKETRCSHYPIPTDPQESRRGGSISDAELKQR
jgi:hypothetical protein